MNIFKALLGLRSIFRQIPAQFFALIFYVALLLPFIGTLTYLDSTIDLVQIYDFYSGGFDRLFADWNSIHPPLKVVLGSLLFSLGGIKPVVLNLFGIATGAFGIFIFYKLVVSLFEKTTAIIASLLLATYPMYLVTSIFFMPDYLLAIAVIVSLYLYLKRRYLLLTISLSLAVLTKETGLLLWASIIFVELVDLAFKIVRRNSEYTQKIRHILALLVPAIVFSLWMSFLGQNGQRAWGDWIFASTASDGAFHTIVNNLISLEFINEYAFQHWKQLFFLNFNWVHWSLLLSAFLVYLRNEFLNGRKTITKRLRGFTPKSKTILIMIAFSVSYILTVLSFQTYTIPRYALPILIIMVTASAVGIRYLAQRFSRVHYILYCIIFAVAVTSIVSSSDPVSTGLWGKTEVLGEELYELNAHLAGNDGLTYNLQFLMVASRRSRALQDANSSHSGVISKQCGWIFPDPNNDSKLLEINNLTDIPPGLPCTAPN